MLDIRKVVLFKTGIGYFERNGRVDLTKNKNVTFTFRKKTMNDILATLSILTESAKIAGISYEASDIDTEKALEGSLIKIPQTEAFTTLIKQLIGTEIKIQFTNHIVEGHILGIQEFEREGKGEQVISEPYILISQNDGQIKNIRLMDITGPDANFLLNDKKMQDELKFFIDTVYLGKKKDSKTLTIYFDGDSTNEEVMIIYLQDTPAWKCSYRLIGNMFEDDDTAFYLQNYALVDNVMDEDWIDVDLTLVSGLPISFVYDLYSPNWINRSFKRPEKSYGLSAVEFEESEQDIGLLPEAEGLPPEEVERKPIKKPSRGLGFAKAVNAPSPSPPPSVPLAASGAPSSIMTSSAKKQMIRRKMKKMDRHQEFSMEMMNEDEVFEEESEIDVDDAESIIRDTTTSSLSFSSGSSSDISSKSVSDFAVSEEAKSSEELAFRYEVPVPTTVKRNQSALIPILQKKIKGEKVSVYNESVREINPMLSINIQNTSGYTLESGPISLFSFDPATSSAIFEGEAVLPFLRQGEERRIPYSVDLQVRVLKKIEDIQNDTRQFTFQDESFYKLVYSIKKFVYKIINSSKSKKTLILEQPKVSGFYLFDTEDPIEKTANYFRFKVEIKPREVKEFVINFRKLNKLCIGLDSIAPNLVNKLYNQGKILSTKFTYQLKMDASPLKLKCCEVNEKKIDDVLQNIIESKFEKEITGKKISLYNYNYYNTYPLKCIEVKNSLDKIIESGPISMYQEGKFLKAGMLPMLEKEEKTNIPYAVDFNCKIVLNTETITEDTGLIYYLWGLFRLKNLIYKYEYNLENLSSDNKSILIEHPKIHFDLFESPEPYEELQNSYRFLVEIDPKSNKKFILKFKGPIRDTFSFTQIAQDKLNEFFRMKLVEDSEVSYKLLRQQEEIIMECYKMSDVNIQKYREDPRVDLVPGRRSKIEKIFSEKVNCKLYLVFNLAKETDNPILNFEIENSLHKTLMCGPVTVYDKGNYIGESILPTLKELDKYRIPIDYDTNVFVVHSMKEKRVREPHEIAFKRSGIFQKYFIIQKNIYTITNDNEYLRDIIIEHPREQGYEIVQGDYQYQEFRNIWSFKTSVPALTKNKIYEFRLKTKTENSIAYKDIYINLVNYWIGKNLLNDEQKAFLVKLAELIEEKKNLLKEISDIQKEYDDIVEDQKRLRANLKSLHSSEQSSRARYTSKLEAQEVKIEELYQKLKELNAKVEPLDKKIDAFVLNEAPITEDDIVMDEYEE
ncbi:MAG: hypothetical protein ACTSRG_06665 [Candidatus Helarchaeota archaeon]